MRIQKLTIFCLIFICCFLILSCNELSQEEIEQRINKSEKLKKLDSFCKNFPTPEGFNFAYKGLGGNSFRISLSYSYNTKLPFSKVRDFYMDYFNNQGWERESFRDEEHLMDKGRIKYRKGKKTVSVEHLFTTPGANYSVGCSEEV